MNASNILAQIAHHLEDWQIDSATPVYYLLSHQKETDAKITLQLRDSRVFCRVKCRYKNKSVFDYVGYSQMDYWEDKKATASISRPAEKIAREFEKKIVSEYLETFKTWRETIEAYLAKQDERDNRCKYFAKLIGSKANNNSFSYSQYPTFSLEGKCLVRDDRITTRLEFDRLNESQTEAILNLVQSWQQPKSNN